jgi:hypothetical protein
MTSLLDLYFPTSWVKRVILESPFAPHKKSTLEHVQYGRKCMRDCFFRNEAPFASHLLYTQPGVLDDKDIVERAAGIRAGMSWGRYAHARVVYVDEGITPGMKEGIKDSLRHGPPIIFRSLKHGTYWISGGWKRFPKIDKYGRPMSKANTPFLRLQTMV